MPVPIGESKFFRQDDELFLYFVVGLESSSSLAVDDDD